MDKKTKFKEFTTSVGKNAKSIFDNAIHSVDQNDDGKFDFEDVSVIAESVGESVKKGTQVIKESADEKMRLLELKTLQPIFVDSLVTFQIKKDYIWLMFFATLLMLSDWSFIRIAIMNFIILIQAIGTDIFYWMNISVI